MTTDRELIISLNTLRSRFGELTRAEINIPPDRANDDVILNLAAAANEALKESGKTLFFLAEDLHGFSSKLPKSFILHYIVAIDSRATALENYFSAIQDYVNMPRSVVSPHQSVAEKKIEEIRDIIDLELARLKIDLMHLRDAKDIHELYPEGLMERASRACTAIEDRQELIEEQARLAEEKTLAISNLAAKAVYDSTRSSFAVLSKAHSRRECRWFWASFASIIALFAAIGDVVFFGKEPTITETGDVTIIKTGEAVLAIFRNSVLIAAPLLLFRVCLTKYNAERHLRILYDHRRAAIQQLETFEKSLGEDASGKAAMRLEAAKMILSDPQTSYASKSEGAELNISPVFSAIERVSKAST